MSSSWIGIQIFSAELRAWARANLGIKVGQTAPGYLRGNGPNKSSLRILEKSWAIQVQRGLGTSFPTLLSEATLAYNAAPNAAIGSSPFFQVFGMEPCLPALQPLFPAHTEEQRSIRQEENRMRCTLCTAVEQQDTLAPHPARNVQCGDHVVHYLSEWRRRTENRKKTNTSTLVVDPFLTWLKRAPRSSSKPLGQRQGQTRKVPIRLVRVLEAAIQAGESQDREDLQEDRPPGPGSTSLGGQRPRQEKPQEED
eukprot:GHVS01032488.1.p1 GENE.GHVS01032488.1~~GHVS01032488.1.p1  ORF type:complete len:253 (-),score=9.70 GHVS01032488.1:48-806(-)